MLSSHKQRKDVLKSDWTFSPLDSKPEQAFLSWFQYQDRLHHAQDGYEPVIHFPDTFKGSTMQSVLR